MRPSWRTDASATRRTPLWSRWAVAAVSSSRRQAIAAALLLLRPDAPPAFADCDAPKDAFKSAAYEKPNYSSAIVASRDTNVSPKEAYDIIAFKAEPPEKSASACPRALDLGAGAGVSTQLLWLNGFRQIVAVDISRTAWDEFVERYGEVRLPAGVSFTQANDDAYLESRGADAEPFDMVVVRSHVKDTGATPVCQRQPSGAASSLGPLADAPSDSPVAPSVWRAGQLRDQSGQGERVRTHSAHRRRPAARARQHPARLLSASCALEQEAPWPVHRQRLPVTPARGRDRVFAGVSAHGPQRRGAVEAEGRGRVAGHLPTRLHLPKLPGPVVPAVPGCGLLVHSPARTTEE